VDEVNEKANTSGNPTSNRNNSARPRLHEERGPDIYNRTSIMLEDRVEVLLDTELILLKLACHVNDDVIAYGVEFNKGQSVWEQIPVHYNYY
jgi:hypothetical protein